MLGGRKGEREKLGDKRERKGAERRRKEWRWNKDKRVPPFCVWAKLWWPLKNINNPSPSRFSLSFSPSPPSCSPPFLLSPSSFPTDIYLLAIHKTVPFLEIRMILWSLDLSQNPYRKMYCIKDLFHFPLFPPLPLPFSPLFRLPSPMPLPGPNKSVPSTGMKGSHSPTSPYLPLHPSPSLLPSSLSPSLPYPMSLPDYEQGQRCSQ